MADRAHRPFSRARWFERLEQMTQACVQSVAADQGKRIREMRDLLARAPEPALLAGLVLPDAASLEARLDAHCWESAAMAMLDADSAYLLSRGAYGRHLASVILPGQVEDFPSPGNTLALALLGAMAQALSQGAPLAFADRDPKPTRHLH
jgi:hypothetical protein